MPHPVSKNYISNRMGSGVIS